MPEFLPLFPLSLVVFPGEVLRLHIFEPRYRQLISECVEQNLTFGIPAVIDRKLTGHATEVEVTEIDKRYPGGEMDIRTAGLRRASISKFYPKAEDKLYSAGDVEWLPDEVEGDVKLKTEVFDLLREFHQALGITKQLANSPETVSAYSIGHHVGLSLAGEYELLILPTENKRLDYIRDHLQKVLPVVKETERLKAKAKLNGHYKNLVPPEF